VSSKRFDGADGLSKRNAIEEEDVEGHSIQRGDGAISRKGADLGEGLTKRNLLPDDGDDVEGHSMVRGEGVRAPFSDEAPGGEGLTRKIGPGEGHSSRT
jgi:hypothetical protein